MATERPLIDAALRGWKSNVERADKLFGAMSPGELEQEIAPGRNRLIYVWGHLAAVNDALLPLLTIGERLHPEFDGMFVLNPDKSVQPTISAESLKTARLEINQKLWDGFAKFRPRIGRSGTRPFRKRISSGNRIGIDSRCCLEEPRTLPITWDRRVRRDQRHS